MLIRQEVTCNHVQPLLDDFNMFLNWTQGISQHGTYIKAHANATQEKNSDCSKQSMKATSTTRVL